MPLNEAFSDQDPGPAERTSILIVDDLPEKLLVFETVLQELEQDIVSVRSGSEALRAILKQEFAVILLDVNMPDIDGFETASLLRKYKRSAHTPIIFITSYADEMQTARGYSLGAVDYILSPVVPEVLRSKVKVFVELHVMQRRLRRQADERVALAAAEAARTAAEEANRRATYLSHASRALSGSLDVRVSMRTLLELIVPELATAATLTLVDDDVTRTLTLTHEVDADATLPRLVEQHLDDVPTLERNALTHALVNASTLHLDLRAENAAAVPLLIGKRALGALLVRDRRAPPHWPTIEDLASRAAVAFENARLYRSLQTEIEERRAAESKLQRANQRKDEFLAMLSHELRNPLAPIRNALEVIRRLAPTEPRLTWATDVTGRQINHLTRLVEELLDVARINQGKIVLKMQAIDLRTVMAQGVEMTRPFIESRHHHLVQKLPAAPVMLRGDAARLAQVIANLLHNAAKYTEEGGSVELELSLLQGHAVISVVDNGMGIEPDLLPNVFELFEQGQRSLDRSQGGLGVGLTLVQRLVQLHHGRVEAFSAGAGHGAEFRVMLPCMSEVPATPEEPAPQPAPPLVQGCRVLVVDDNRDAAETTAAFLELAGHEVRAVIDGPQALSCAPVFAPDVVVLDIGLPLMDGYETARHLRALPETRTSFLVAVTGYGQEGDRLRAIEAGFDEHLMKPAEPTRLIQLIADWHATSTDRAAASASRRHS